MKKIFAILLILCFVLTGCNVEKTNSDLHASISSDLLYSNISSETQKTENASTVITSSKSNSAEEIIDDNRGAICESVEYHANFKTMNEFVKWAKKGGEENPAWNESKDNSCSAFFLDWRKNKSEMVIPKLKNNEYYLRVASADDDHLEFRFFLKNEPSNTSKPDVINIFGFPLTEEQKSLSLKELTEMFNPMEDIYYGDSVWGEYIAGTEYSIAITLGFVKSSMFFVVKPAGMIENTINPWQEEYFDYFDFETVSLK